LHLVGYLYYWQMGFNSVFKGLRPLRLKMNGHCIKCKYVAIDGAKHLK